MRTGYCQRIPEPQTVEFIDCIILCKIIHLVDGQNDRLFCFMQQSCDIFIIMGQTILAAYDKYNAVCLINSDFHLHVDFRLEILICKLNTSGIDHPEFSGQPFRFSIDTIPGYSRCILHNTFTFTDNSVKNR